MKMEGHWVLGRFETEVRLFIDLVGYEKIWELRFYLFLKNQQNFEVEEIYAQSDSFLFVVVVNLVVERKSLVEDLYFAIVMFEQLNTWSTHHKKLQKILERIIFHILKIMVEKAESAKC